MIGDHGCDAAGSYILEIKDFGAGISKENMDMLFQEGVEYDVNRLQSGHGSGLGLWISKRIIELHHGTIRATSQGNGQGSTFTIELPLVLKQFQKDKSNCSQKQKRNENIVLPSPQEFEIVCMGESLGSPKINIDMPPIDEENKLSYSCLVVDDALSSRKILSRILSKLGHECSEAYDGLNCLEVFRSSENPFDVILMDFEMPNMKGPEATRELRSMGYRGVIIGVTGNVLLEDQEYFRHSGADDVVLKPVKIDILLATIKKYFGS
jgi:CheY-like chemotaxis protein